MYVSTEQTCTISYSQTICCGSFIYLNVHTLINKVFFIRATFISIKHNFHEKNQMNNDFYCPQTIRMLLHLRLILMNTVFVRY